MRERIFAEGLDLIESHAGDGRRLFRSSIPLPADRPDILVRLRYWAESDPARPLLTEPMGGQRRVLTYCEAAKRSVALATELSKSHGLHKGDRIATLAPAGIDALLLKLACLRGGFVHVALPPFAFRDGGDTETGRALMACAPPKLITAPRRHAAIGALGARDLAGLVAASGTGGRAFADAVFEPEDVVAIFFTSGSTGAPKGVSITRGMISSNQAAIAAMWPFMQRSPVLVDWLPWHHVFGGLDNIFKMIWNGGTMHVDSAPSVVSMDATVRLMAEVGPTLHIAVPLGLKFLLDRMEEDKEAARACTASLKAIFFAGAGIDSVLWNRLKRFRDRHGTFEILSGYGATEAASTICLSPTPLESPGELGHPLPGHEICLVEGDGGSELRVRGPNIAPGYLTAEGPMTLPLDEAGFYRTGDAAVLRLRNDATPVLAFDGRLAEDFKLSSGIKVRAGALRARLLAHCAPLVDDLVVDGENRHTLVALFFPAASCAGKADLAPLLARALAAWNEANGGTSTAISRFAIASLPPDRGRGELSDKGQIVRSVYLRNHAALFAALHEGAGHPPEV